MPLVMGHFNTKEVEINTQKENPYLTKWPMPSPGLPDGQVRRLHPPTPFLWMSCFYRTNKSHNGGVIKTKRCVAHLSSEHRTIGSVALVVKPSTTAEDVQAVSPLSRGGGGGVKHKIQILTSSAVLWIF